MKGNIVRLSTDYLYPSFVATTLLATVFTSGLSYNLWVIRGTQGEAVVFLYVALLAWVQVKPSVRVHMVGAVLGAFVFAARAGAFMALVLDAGRMDLIGSIFERALMGASVLLWHGYQVWRLEAGRDIDDLLAIYHETGLGNVDTSVNPPTGE